MMIPGGRYKHVVSNVSLQIRGEFDAGIEDHDESPGLGVAHVELDLGAPPIELLMKSHHWPQMTAQRLEHHTIARIILILVLQPQAGLDRD